MAYSLNELKKLVKDRRAQFGHDPTPGLVKAIAADADWLEHPEQFLLEDTALLFKINVENNIRLARFLRMTGELVPRDQVLQIAASAAKELAQVFEGFPDRLAPQLAAITDPKQVRLILRRAIVECLDSFRQDWTPVQAQEMSPDRDLMRVKPSDI